MSITAGSVHTGSAGGTDGKKPSTFEQYIEGTGRLVHRVSGVPSLVELELGGRDDGLSSAYVVLDGMQGMSSLEVVELPAGASITQRHLYEEYVLALSGQGTARFDGADGRSRELSWGKESVFAVPLNMRVEIRNTSAEAARLVLVNTAHLMMDLLGSAEAVFSSDLVFPERESALLDGSVPGDLVQSGRRTAYQGPIIDQLGSVSLPEHAFIRGPGFGYLRLDLGGGVYGSHVGELPEGHISNAHWHMGGAVLIALRGEGYTQAWPSRAGAQPAAGEVLRDDFGYSGAVSVGTGWFHLHANTGRGPLRQVAFRYGGGAGATFSTVQGTEYEPGRVVDVEDLSDDIRSGYLAELADRGIPAAD